MMDILLQISFYHIITKHLKGNPVNFKEFDGNLVKNSIQNTFAVSI